MICELFSSYASFVAFFIIPVLLCFVYDSYEHEIIYTVRAIAVFKFYSLRN